MNFQHILQHIEQVDPEVYDKLDTRRNSLKSFTGIGKKIALTALPFAIGGLFKKAYGQSTGIASITDVLNFALTLEFLEASFYTQAVGTSGLIADSNEMHSFEVIKNHENAHVAVLQQTITALGGTPVSEPTFDFTAGGTFPDVFATKDFDTFLALSQTFEDTGVRAYKGQAANANLMANNDVLTAALQIHAVEARHAAHVRRLRRMRTGDAGIKPWITNDAPTIPAVQSTYMGEENVVQGGVNITTLPGVSGTISMAAATEAFDEPLDMNAILAIVSPFIK